MSQKSDQLKRYHDGMERETRKRELKKQNKQFAKRGRDVRPPRRRDWHDVGEDEVLYERIMPRDEAERRQAVKSLSTQRESPEKHLPDNLPVGRVLQLTSGICRVQMGEETQSYTLRGSLSLAETGFMNPVAVGDWVQVEGEAIVGVLPRQNRLSRPDSFYPHLHQIIAANVDQLLIVVAWRDPKLWPEMIDRYLISAKRFEIEAIICINKTDLAHRQSDIDEYRLPYEALGYPVILTSIPKNNGLEALRQALAGKTSVLTGLSGVGKSSLLTAIEPSFRLKTGEIGVAGEGKHTTTQALMLPFGDGYVIDTPGIREFGLSDLSRAEVRVFYAELQPWAEKCRFRTCTHFHEPDCAVRAAAEAGEISAWRYENYQDIFVAADS